MGIVALAATVAATGCDVGGDDEDPARSALETFLGGIQERDADAYCGSLILVAGDPASLDEDQLLESARATERDCMRSFDREAARSEKDTGTLESFEIHSVDRTDGEATAEVTLEFSSNTLDQTYSVVDAGEAGWRVALPET